MSISKLSRSPETAPPHITTESIVGLVKANAAAADRARRLGVALWNNIHLAADDPREWRPTIKKGNEPRLADLPERHITPNATGWLVLRIPSSQDHLINTPAWLKSAQEAELRVCAHKSPLPENLDLHFCDERYQAPLQIMPLTSGDASTPVGELRGQLYRATYEEGSALSIPETELVINILNTMVAAH